MTYANIYTQAFLMLTLALGLLLWGCEPPVYGNYGDDDDAADDDASDDDASDDDASDDDASDDDASDDDASDDDTGDDDTGDDDTGDDDTGDDDTGDDDDAVYSYYQEQTLAGGPTATACPGCDFVFDVTYTTTVLQGQATYAAAFPDGVYTMAFDADYYIQGYGTYPMVLIYNAGWAWWYMAYENYNNHSVAFYYSYAGAYYQYGYWDVTGQNMTGWANNYEP